MLIIIAVCAAPVEVHGQYVGGETVYVDPESQKEEMAPGVRLYLIAGVYHAARGIPSASQILDQDVSASTSTGDPPFDRALFVLASKNSAFNEVTVLHYAWTPDGKQNSLLLSRVVTPKVVEKDHLLRAKVRLNCTPTNGTLETSNSVTTAVRNSLIASEFARLLDVDDDARRRNLQKELRIIGAMIDHDNRRRIIDEVFNELRDSPLFEEIMADCEDAFRADQVSDVRKQQIALWDQLYRTNPSDRSIDSRPR